MATAVNFTAAQSTLVLTWPGLHSWQLRVHLGGPPPPAASAAFWTAEIETSPDKDGRHRDAFAQVLDGLRALGANAASVQARPGA